MKARVIFALLLAALIGFALWNRGVFAPPEPEFRSYSVVKGDTLSRIAKAEGVTVDELRAWNGLSGDTIEIGQVLRIYTEASPQPAPTTPKKKGARRAPRAPQGSLSTGSAPAPESALKMPPAQPCLAGPTDVEGDEGMATNQGLSYEQLRSSMNNFVGNTLRCLPPEGVTGTLTLDITVACSGQVSVVEVTDDGGLDAGLAACVQEVLGYTPFPAHDMPDGYSFGYPLRFTAPEPSPP